MVFGPVTEDRRTGQLWQPPRARVTHSVAQAIANNLFVALAFDTMQVNVGNLWRGAANTRLTVDLPGWYEYHASVEFAAVAAGTYRHLTIRANGATFIDMTEVPPVAGGVNPTRLSLAGGMQLARGWYLEAVVAQDSGAALNVAAAADFTPIFTLIWRCPLA